MEPKIPEQNTVAYFIYIFRREGFGIPELEKEKAQYIVGSPAHLAAVQLIAEKSLEIEKVRHSEVVGEAKSANRLAKWAIAIALVSAVIAVLAVWLD